MFHLTLNTQLLCHIWEPEYFREWQTERVNHVFTGNTHKKNINHAVMVRIEAGWLDKTGSHLQPNHPKYHKIDRWNWRKIKMFMMFTLSGFYLRLQMWFTASHFLLLLLLFFLLFRLHVSQLCHLVSPASNWLSGSSLLLHDALVLLLPTFLLLLLLFHVSCSHCSTSIKRDRDVEKNSVGRCVWSSVSKCFQPKEEIKIFFTLCTEQYSFK